MTDRRSTLDIITEQAKLERAAQARHFDSLDSKAGIVMGFSGVIVALGGPRSSAAIAGHFMAALAALFALWAFAPRSLPAVSLLELAEHYAGSDPAFVKAHLFEASIEAVGRASELVKAKARKVMLSMMALAAAVAVTAGAILLK